MMTSNNQHSVLAALAAVQDHHSDNQLRTSAETYLIKFRDNSEAWDFAFNQLLSESPYSAQLFAAQTIKYKCKKQCSNISHAQQEQLFSSLLQLLAVNRHKSIQSQLVLALVYLQLQLHKFNNADCLNSVYNTVQESTYLAYVTTLAEEAVQSHFAAHASGADDSPTLATEVRALAPQVFQHLARITQNAESAPGTEVYPKAIACFTAWVQAGALSSTTEAQFLIGSCLRALSTSSQGVFDAAVECLVEVVQHSPDDILGQLLPHLLPQGQAAAAAASQGHPERCLGLSKVFSAYVAAVQQEALAATPAGAQLRQGLLQLALLHPHGSREVAAAVTASLEAWGALADGAVSLEDEGSELCSGAVECFGQLLQGQLQHLAAWAAAAEQLPEELEDADDAEDLVRATQDVFDCLGGVLGGERYFAVLVRFVEHGGGGAGAAGVEVWRLVAALKASAAAEGVLQGLQLPGTQMLTTLLLRAAPLLQPGAQQQPPPAAALPALRQVFCTAVAAASGALVFQADSMAPRARPGDFLQLLFSTAMSCMDEPPCVEPAARACSYLAASCSRCHISLSEPVAAALINRLDAASAAPSCPEAHRLLAAAAASAATSLPSAPDGSGPRSTAVHRILLPLHTLLQDVVPQLPHHPWLHLAPHVEPPLLARLTCLDTLLDASLAHPPSDDPSSTPSSAPPQVQLFASELWPALQRVVVAVPAGAVLRSAGACCLKALQHEQQQGDLLGRLLPGALQVTAAVAFRPEGSGWAEVPATLLQQLQPEQLRPWHGPLVQCLVQLLSSAQARSLHQPGAADQDPEAAQHLLHLAAAVLRFSSQLPLSQVADSKQLLADCIALGTAASYCNHKRVAAAALAAVAAAIAAAAADGPARQPVCQCVLASGSQIMAALIGTLLAASPLPRLQRSATLLADLTALLHLPHVTPLWPPPASSPLPAWLSAALQSLQPRGIPPEDAQQLLHRWLPALQQCAADAAATQAAAAAGAGAGASARAVPARGRQEGLRALKGALRAFAESHAEAPAGPASLAD